MIDLKIFQSIVEELGKGSSVVLLTVVKKVGSAPRDVGAKMILREDGTVVGTLGGGVFENMVLRDALQVLREGKSVVKKYVFRREGVVEGEETGLICGGEVEVFMDVIKPMPRLIVIGAGHVAEALYRVGSIIGYRIVIVDVNPEYLTKDRFPEAEDLVLSKDLADWVEKVNPSNKDLILIVYGGVEEDYRALTSALKTEAKYIGLLGSKRKCAEFLKKLKDQGYREEDLKGRVYMPVGIGIGADTPEEIAIAIIAELIKIQKCGELKHLTIL
ncbi:MAG: XdhC/CoxI family protein [Nitrososphaerota archaeon]